MLRLPRHRAYIMLPPLLLIRYITMLFSRLPFAAILCRHAYFEITLRAAAMFYRHAWLILRRYAFDAP